MGRKVPAKFYVNSFLSELLFDELKAHVGSKGFGGFIPAVMQLANVAALPGILKVTRYSSRLLIDCVSCVLITDHGICVDRGRSVCRTFTAAMVSPLATWRRST